MVYIFFIVLLIILNLILKQLKFNQKNSRKIFISFTFLGMFFLAAFRDVSVGTDTEQFVNSYIIYSKFDISIVSFGQIYEPGFMFALWLLSRLSNNPRLLLVVTSLFINFSVCFFIYKHAKDYFSSVIIYICSCQFLVSMCMMRQFIAISIILLSFSLLLNKKFIRFAISCLLAASFHYFSLLFIFFIPAFMIKKLTKAQITLIMVIYIPVYILFPKLMMSFFSHSNNYGDYLESLSVYTDLVSWFRIPPMILVVLALLLPYLINYKIYVYNVSYTSYKGKDYSFINIIYFGLALLIILSIRFGLFTRVYYYLTPFLILAPNLISRQEGTNSHTVYFVLIGIAIFALCLLLDKGTYGAGTYIFMGN